MTMRLVLFLGVVISLWNACLASDPTVQLDPDQSEEESTGEDRACRLHELLPQRCGKKSREWTTDYVVEPLYDCTCAAMKGRYFCPAQNNQGYPKWEPLAVGKGVCKSITRSSLVGQPLPPNFKVLMYGNSHLRQVVEAVMCMFQDDLSSKRVNAGVPSVEAFVAADMQCRACSLPREETAVTDIQRRLLEHQCITEGDPCRCWDSRGEFFFENGAAVHYSFAHTQENKGLDHALQGHEMEFDSTYDAVFMNAGNSPPMDAESAIKIASEVQASGSQFFWLSTYNGVGNISKWKREERKRFSEAGALYIDVECMAKGMHSYTAGAIEGAGADSHFCLPGPPNEIAVLLLKMMWAMYREDD